jgi:hypothetical protein
MNATIGTTYHHIPNPSENHLSPRTTVERKIDEPMTRPAMPESSGEAPMPTPWIKKKKVPPITSLL